MHKAGQTTGSLSTVLALTVSTCCHFFAAIFFAFLRFLLPFLLPVQPTDIGRDKDTQLLEYLRPFLLAQVKIWQLGMGADGRMHQQLLHQQWDYGMQRSLNMITAILYSLVTLAISHSSSGRRLPRLASEPH